jgi:Tfp pilus assembly protein FimT
MAMPSGSKMTKSGRMGSSATGSAMAGMSMSGEAESLKAGLGFARGGAVLFTLGAGVWFLG